MSTVLVLMLVGLVFFFGLAWHDQSSRRR